MDKRFLAIWATTSIGLSAMAMNTSKPLEMSVACALLGLGIAFFDKRHIRD
jgi:hypothetical protein